MSYEIKRKNLKQVAAADKNSQTKLVVPDFQRKYVWKVAAEVEDFWQDITENFNSCDDDNIDKDEMGLFMGNVILLNESSFKNKIEVIDGQQRFTTISIFLIAFRRWLRSYQNKLLSENNSRMLSQVTQNVSVVNDILNVVNNQGIVGDAKLVPASNILDYYNHIVDIEWDGKFKNEIPVSGKISSRKRQKVILEPIYNLFKQGIKDLLDDNPDRFKCLYKVITSLSFVRVDIEDLNQAYLFFERTNSRGKNLDVGDLVKAHLFGENPYPSDIIKSMWTEIDKNSGGRLPKLLRYFYISYKEPTTGHRLFNSLKSLMDKEETDSHYRKENAKLIIDNLSKFSNFFSAVNNIDFNTTNIDSNKELQEVFIDLAGDSDDLIFSNKFKFNGISRSFDALKFFNFSSHIPLVWSLLVKFYELKLHKNPTYNSERTLLQLFRNMENIHFLNRVCKISGGRIEPIYMKSAAKFIQCKNESEFQSRLKLLYSELKKHLPTKETFIDNFKEINYEKNFEDIYYIFDRFNEKITNPNNNQDVNIAEASRLMIFQSRKRKVGQGEFNIEHWFPQSEAKKIVKEDICQEAESQCKEKMLENVYKKAYDQLTDDQKEYLEKEVKKNIKSALEKNPPNVPDWCHSIGNLMVIPEETNNVILDDNSPQIKYKHLKDNDFLNNIPHNKVFFDEYIKKHGTFENWGKKEIEVRGEALAKEAYVNVWNFTIPKQIQNFEVLSEHKKEEVDSE